MESAFGCQEQQQQDWLQEADAVGCGQDELDFDDDFEKEMSAELEERVQRAEQDGGLRGIMDLPSSVSRKTKDRERNPDLMDSDDEEEEEVEGEERLPQPSNDELLFDPGSDNEDQKWADRVRRWVKKADIE